GEGVAVNHQQRATRSAGSPILAGRLFRPVPSPVRWVDRSVFGEAVVVAGIVWPLACRSRAPRRSGPSRSLTHTCSAPTHRPTGSKLPELGPILGAKKHNASPGISRPRLCRAQPFFSDQRHDRIRPPSQSPIEAPPP